MECIVVRFSPLVYTFSDYFSKADKISSIFFYYKNHNKHGLQEMRSAACQTNIIGLPCCKPHQLLQIQHLYTNGITIII